MSTLREYLADAAAGLADWLRHDPDADRADPGRLRTDETRVGDGHSPYDRLPRVVVAPPWDDVAAGDARCGAPYQTAHRGVVFCDLPVGHDEGTATIRHRNGHDIWETGTRPGLRITDPDAAIVNMLDEIIGDRPAGRHFTVPRPRRFEVVTRHKEAGRYQTTNHLAEGVQWTDGSVAVRRYDPGHVGTDELFSSIPQARAWFHDPIDGHRPVFQWVDDE